MFKVDIGAIKDRRGEKEHYKLRENLGALEAGDQKLIFVGPVKIDLDIINTGSYFWAQGWISCRVRMACSRCLDQFDYLLETEFAEKYCLSYNQENSGAKVVKNEEEDCITFTGDVIDIGEEVEKTILMVLPMKAVCNPDCRGLCPQCGKNLNEGECDCVEDEIDPRLAELKKLLNKND